MIRQAMIKRSQKSETPFRQRGAEVSRLEGFSDAAFAFALTLLVVSLEVPRTFAELLDAMRGFGAFAICLGGLMWVWYQHYTFFRRYGMQDAVTIWLNAVLLFVILFYVYPLKFLFTALLSEALPILRPTETPYVDPLADDATGGLMIIYGVGYMAVFGVFALLYWHAYRSRSRLELNAVEQYDTLESVRYNLALVGIGVLSVAIAVIGGADWAFWSGMVYALTPLLIFILERRAARGRLKLDEKFSAG
jgi:uncharacterized membrane protein